MLPIVLVPKPMTITSYFKKALLPSVLKVVLVKVVL